MMARSSRERSDGESLTTQRQLRTSVRRFRREGLLRRLGALTAEEWTRSHERQGEFSHPFPWATSLIAREALLSPSSSSRTGRLTNPSRSDVDELSYLAANMAPPLGGAEGEQVLHNFALQTVYQQWPYAGSDLFGNIARLRPMLERSFPTGRFEILSGETLKEVLGAPIDVFIDSAPFFGAAASANEGKFDESWLLGSQFDEVRARIDFEELLSVFRTAWAAGLNELRREAQAVRSSDEASRQFDWNPFLARPFVRLNSGEFVAPQVRWAHQRISPTAVYYLGHASYGETWAHDLGKAQEDYILLQLKQLESVAVVAPEVEWKVGKNAVRSVDALVRFGDCTVLVESKSLRTRLDSTTDFATYSARLSRSDFFKALEKQIPRTLSAIRANHPAFFAFPNDGNPILALIVTPEPLYLANIPAQRQLLPDPGIPYAIISLGELEQIVAAALMDKNGSIFQAVTAVRSDGSVDPNAALKSRFTTERPNNPLLQTSWSKGRWN